MCVSFFVGEIMIEKYMRLALKQAEKSLDVDVPVGAIIVKNNKIIARGFNKKELEKNAIKHAEIIAIEKACKKLKTWHLEDCEIYITMEPCLMCVGAIIQSRISKVYYGVKNNKFGISNYFDIENRVKINNHYIKFYGGFLKDEIEKQIKDFFKQKRTKVR